MGIAQEAPELIVKVLGYMPRTNHPVPAQTLGERGRVPISTESYGVLRAAMRDRSRDTMDRLITALAVSAGVVLVTNNEADFKDYPGLKIENWTLGV